MDYEYASHEIELIWPSTSEFKMHLRHGLMTQEYIPFNVLFLKLISPSAHQEAI